MTNEPGGFQRALADGRLTVAVECVPPARPDAEAVRATAAALRGKVDAVGVADNRSEILMSSVAAASILQSEGIEPIVHMTVRDRNRIALMSDVMGAAALGLRNVLCTTGDHQTLGRARAARNVFDIDAVQFLQALDTLRTRGVLFEEGWTAGKCDLVLGAVASPHADPQEMQALRVAKKIEAGADFIVTQPVFDVEHFERWLGLLKEWGVDGKAPILAGILVPPSAERATEMREKVPGVEIPDAIIERLGSVGTEQQRGEAVAVAAELIGRLRKIDGVGGVYLMTEGDDAAAVEVIERAELKGA